ncbi:hypothetical protein YC2023_052904 [Brassica napus]
MAHCVSVLRVINLAPLAHMSSLRREAASKEVEDNVASSYQGTGAEHERSTVATGPREMRPQTLIARCLQLPNNPPNKANPENHERSQATTTSSEQKYMHKAIWRIDRGVERHTVGAQNSEVENRSKPQCTAIGATVRRALNPSYENPTQPTRDHQWKTEPKLVEPSTKTPSRNPTMTPYPPSVTRHTER